MAKVLIIPDVHGRKFWVDSCQDISLYRKVIFLGDYMDPYEFENIKIEDAIENFKKIVEFKKSNIDKVVLLLGNHDMPYYSKEYFNMSFFHCRYSKEHGEEISKIFDENRELFQLAYAENEILYSHAGIIEPWLREAVGYTKNDVDGIVREVNKMVNSKEGLSKLFLVGYARGGRSKTPSCIWVDVFEFMDFSNDDTDFCKIKQVFGHTYQFISIVKKKPIIGPAKEGINFKMLDCAKSFVLDESTFKLENERNKEKI